MFTQALTNAMFQLVLFSIIPFVWWVFTVRKRENFFTWIGLIRPAFDNKTQALFVSCVTLALLTAIGLCLIFMFDDKSLLSSAIFADAGVVGIAPVLIYAILQTGLSEEIFFRGFLGKRLSNKFGFVTGNSIQAVLFCLVHGVLLFGNVGMMWVIAVTVFTGIVGWLMGYLNEKLGNGSIIPSWIIHSLMNIISSSMFLFNIVTI